MDIKCYIAMTASELSSTLDLPQHIAYMGCHYSSSSRGLSNLPDCLPPGAMVIVDDLMPPQDHDPEQIAMQLTQLASDMSVSAFLLDFQRPNIPKNQTIATFLTQALPCPVGVTPAYAADLNCPVFLPPPPLHTPLEKHIVPWKGREIWLEIAAETCLIKITPDGSNYTQISHKPPAQPHHYEASLHCRYHIEILEDSAAFTLHRDRQELLALLQEAQTLGVCCAVGLYQQLKIFP